MVDDDRDQTEDSKTQDKKFYNLCPTFETEPGIFSNGFLWVIGVTHPFTVFRKCKTVCFLIFRQEAKTPTCRVFSVIEIIWNDWLDTLIR